MYKTSEGRKRFSLSRFMINSFPVSALDSKSDVDLSPKQADGLFKYQIKESDPRLLGPDAFYHARITENKTYSRRVHTALTKHSILTPATPASPINTAAITRHFSNQVACISVHQQRKLVGLLFAWEEELTRWRLLDEEEAEIKEVMRGMRRDSETLGDLTIRLEGVRLQRMLAPGERSLGVKDQLPVYVE